jgi:hypothetical protein
MNEHVGVVLEKLIQDKKADVAPSMKTDDYFELFSAEQILKELDLSYDELIIGNIGNGGDGGIDSIHITANELLINPDDELPKFKGDVNIEIYIIQSKNENSFTESVVEKFRSSAEDIFCFEKTIDELKSVYNNQLIRIIETIREIYLSNLSKIPTVKFYYFYASKGNEIHPNVVRKVESLKDTIKRFFSNAEIEFQFVTGKMLLDIALTKKKKSYNIKFAESPVSTSDGGYIGIVNLTEYYNFIIDDNSKLVKFLFDANVRDYQAGATVNKEIHETLSNRVDSDFWWYNNGITIITEKASLANKVLTLVDPQVVNGCQTSYEIYNYLSTVNAKEEKRSVAIKVIETTDESIRANIIKFTNSQTIIPLSVLTATDPIHRNIEQYFLTKSLYYDRRKNYWKNEQKPIKNIISISTLAQAFKAMILQEPNISRAKPSSLMREEIDYKCIFSTEYNLEGYYKIIQIQRAIEDRLMVYGGFQPGDALNIRYHLQMYFVYSQRKYKVKEVKNPKKYLDAFIKQDFNMSEENIDKCIDFVLSVFIKKGRTDSVSKSKTFKDELLETK